MSVNKVILLGRLGADPEVRMTPAGKQVATINLATSEKYTDRTGQKQESTEWHRCVLWEKKAELAGKYLRKGSQVFLEGKLKTRSWEDQNGQKRYTTEIQVEAMTFVEKGASGGGDNRQAADQAPGAYYGQPQASFSGRGQGSQYNGSDMAMDLPDDDVPF